MPYYEARSLLEMASDPDSALQKLKESNVKVIAQEKEILELKKMCYELRSELEDAHANATQQLRTYGTQLEKAGETDRVRQGAFR